jgi:integrase
MQTNKKPNKPVTQRPRSRNPNGYPQPYRDGNRWKAKGTFLDGDGVKHIVYGTGSTQHGALKRRDELLLAKRKSMALEKLPRNVIYVDEYCRHWLEVVKQGQANLAFKTYVGYKSAIDKWISPYLGKIKLVQLNRQHLVSLMNFVLEQGLSKSMQNQIRAVLKPALDEAELEGYIDKTPWRAIKLAKAKSGQPDYFDIAEVNLILAKAKSEGTLLHWQLYLVYGPRQGECLGLRWSDLDLDDVNPSLTFSRQIQRVTGKGLVALPLKTGSSYRKVALSDYMSELFKAAREAHKTAQAVNGEGWNPEGYVFVTPLGTPIDPANDRKSWVKLLDSAGVQQKPLHVARHTAATHASDINIASKLLGHSSIRVTADFYAASPLDAMRASAEALEGKLKKLDPYP